MIPVNRAAWYPRRRMTPLKCWRHEQRPGELGDSPRYVRALAESRSCWRCRLLAGLARTAYIFGLERSKVLGWLVRPLTNDPEGFVDSVR